MPSLKLLLATTLVVAAHSATVAERAHEISSLTSYVAKNGHHMDESDMTRVLEGLIPILSDLEDANEAETEQYIRELEKLAQAAEATMTHME